MADEIKVTELPIKIVNGQIGLYDHTGMIGQNIDASGTQDNSAAFGDQTRMISVLNTHSAACNIRVWDYTTAPTTVTATNSQPIAAGERLDFIVASGQMISSKVL